MVLAICIAAAAMAVVAAILCFALESRTMTEALFFSIGVAMMSLLNVCKIVLLERTVKKALELDNQDFGRNYVRFQYLGRYFLTAIVLLGAGLIG